MGSLTKREIEVLILVARGRTLKSIATELGLRPSTVRNHCTCIQYKLRAVNNVSAVIAGMVQGYFSLEDVHG